ncbi:MAG: selenoneine biosynthesis selenosugar synthase SenB [Pirellulales bacterium]
MSRILIVTPAPHGSRKGNRLTAERWAMLVRRLGHRIAIAESYTGQEADAVIALHARKSAASIRRVRSVRPQTPIVAALTGTDLYHDLPDNRAAAESLQIADRLVVLQPLALRALPRSLHAKTRVIVQSVAPLATAVRPLPNRFEVCVSGHLRSVKDPFRAAAAVRSLPAESKIQITHLGGALTAAMEQRARRETQRNPRYRWLGDVSHHWAMRLLKRSRLLAITSKLEGCPTVLSEAIANGTPVAATRIDGNVGLLGEDYAGYFEVGATRQLRDLLLRCEEDAQFLQHLQAQCRAKAPLVEPQREQQAWQELLRDVNV